LILFPEAAKGSLLDYIRSIGYLSEAVAIFYIKQIVNALSYTQQKGIIHPHLLA
jgi:serine/threonine protein kinase